MATDVRAAYRRCEEITWSQARNFSYGIRLLPPAKRHALAAVYAFARRIDDIGDGTLPPAEKLAALEGARAGLSALIAGLADDSDQVLMALADAATRFDIPLAAFGELIDGCADDVRGVTYVTFDDLLHYCRCVAGAIGRLSLGVFGTSDPDTAAPLADSLGVALQLTNILRDIREDYAIGRVYLPAEDLARFGCVLDADPATHPGQRELTALVEFEADRARSWYATGLTLMPLLDRRSAASAGAMAGIYFRLLEHIAASPAAVLTRRVSLSTREKAGVAVKSLAAAALRPPGRPRHPPRRRERPGDRNYSSPRARRGGGRRAGGHHRRHRARRDRRPGHAARISASAGRRHLLVQPWRSHRRQRAARVPALLHRLPWPASPARHDRLCRLAGPVRRHRAAPRRPRQTAPHRAPRAAAHGPGTGRLPAPFLCRTIARGARRPRHDPARPGQPGAGLPAPR